MDIFIPHNIIYTKYGSRDEGTYHMHTLYLMRHDIVNFTFTFCLQCPVCSLSPSIYIQHVAFRLKITVSPALKEGLERGFISLEGDLARGLIQARVCLEVDSAGLLLGQNGVADLGAPEVHADVGHVVVKFETGLDVASALVDVNLLQVLADGYGCVSILSS